MGREKQEERVEGKWLVIENIKERGNGEGFMEYIEVEAHVHIHGPGSVCRKTEIYEWMKTEHFKIFKLN